MELCYKYNVKHVRGRARCSWIQGQIERCNQTIKWMVASTLISRNMMGQWYKILEEVTWSYNNLRHGTTRQTLFTLMFGKPIRDLINETRITEILASILSEEVSIFEEEDNEEFLHEVLNLNNFDTDFTNAIDNMYMHNNENLILTEIYHGSARVHTQVAANRMVERSMWRNDHFEFNIGDKVIIRPQFDNNTTTRRQTLYEHLDTDVYVVMEVLQFNKVKLYKELEPSMVIEEISIRELRLIETE